MQCGLECVCISDYANMSCVHQSLGLSPLLCKSLSSRVSDQCIAEGEFIVVWLEQTWWYGPMGLTVFVYVFAGGLLFQVETAAVWAVQGVWPVPDPLVVDKAQAAAISFTHRRRELRWATVSDMQSDSTSIVVWEDTWKNCLICCLSFILKASYLLPVLLDLLQSLEKNRSS